VLVDASHLFNLPRFLIRNIILHVIVD